MHKEQLFFSFDNSQINIVDQYEHQCITLNGSGQCSDYMNNSRVQKDTEFMSRFQFYPNSYT